jgi:cytochrome c556
MREKLGNAQQLLEAVVRADFPAIARSADRLSRISDTEIASWQAMAQPAYTEQASRFLIAVQRLREAAASQNSQAATDEYATLVSSCVRCHQYVRNSRMASLAPERPAPAGRRPGR